MNLFEPMTFKRGPAMPNRFALAPLTNCQSHADGTLSSEEHHWLAMRAKGGFGLTMTAAAHVQPVGQGFAGQLGIFDDKHIPALSSLAKDIKAAGSLAIVQLHHAGLRHPKDLHGLTPVGPSDDAQSGGREMSTAEVEAMIEAFIAAAERAEKAGFDGVELHGAHSYLLCVFLSDYFNKRTDQYGGSLENRARPIREIIAGIRSRCRPDFNLGIRLSGERMGIKTGETVTLVQELMNEGQLDYIDMSLWDVFKEPEEPEFKGKPLINWFTDLDRGDTRLGVAGQIRSGVTAIACLEAGADFVFVGRAAIPHHDFPNRVKAEGMFNMMDLPIPPAHLASEGVSPPFVEYLSGSFAGFVEKADA